MIFICIFVPKSDIGRGMKRNNIVVRCILLGFLVVLRLSVEAQERLVMPAALKVGDTIAIVSPSSTPDSMTVVKGCQTLREWP